MIEINDIIELKTNTETERLSFATRYLVQISFTFNLTVLSDKFSGTSHFCVRRDQLEKMCCDLSEMNLTLNGKTILDDNDSDAFVEFELEPHGGLSIRGQVGGTHEDHFVKFRFQTDQTCIADFVKDFRVLLHKTKTKDLYEEIDEILWNDCGPIGLDEKQIKMSNEFDNAVSVEFPLRGEWMAPHTPGTKIPSHGSDQLGQRYAFDFLQVNWDKKGMHFFDASLLRYLIFGVPLEKNYCWGREIYAPCEGKIIECKDGLKERNPVHLVSDLFVVLKNAFFGNLEKKGLHSFVGNYIIMECENGVYAFFAHIKKNSIKVSVGENIKRGQILGQVGHSGNSTGAHLHFQLMDSGNLLKAKGIPCVFEKYEVYRENSWKLVCNSVPTDKDRIRYNT